MAQVVCRNVLWWTEIKLGGLCEKQEWMDNCTHSALNASSCCHYHMRQTSHITMAWRSKVNDHHYIYWLAYVFTILLYSGMVLYGKSCSHDRVGIWQSVWWLTACDMSWGFLSIKCNQQHGHLWLKLSQLAWKQKNMISSINFASWS